MDALISEICRRVQQKIDAMDSTGGDREKDTRPALLILTPDHGTCCHEMLENKDLAECYRMECAVLKEYQCMPDDYEAVIAFGMSNEFLGKIAYGIFDSGYTRMFGQALLAGKKIYLAEEEIELYRYRGTAPQTYYGCLEANLEMLVHSGVTIASRTQIPDLILHGEPQAASEEKAPKEEAAEPLEIKEAVLDKKVITEKDMIALGNDRVQKVTVGEKAIMTDLAKEYASKHRITVLRRGASQGKERRP